MTKTDDDIRDDAELLEDARWYAAHHVTPETMLKIARISGNDPWLFQIAEMLREIPAVPRSSPPSEPESLPEMFAGLLVSQGYGGIAPGSGPPEDLVEDINETIENRLQVSGRGSYPRPFTSRT